MLFLILKMLTNCGWMVVIEHSNWSQRLGWDPKILLDLKILRICLSLSITARSHGLHEQFGKCRRGAASFFLFLLPLTWSSFIYPFFILLHFSFQIPLNFLNSLNFLFAHPCLFRLMGNPYVMIWSKQANVSTRNKIKGIVDKYIYWQINKKRHQPAIWGQL